MGKPPPATGGGAAALRPVAPMEAKFPVFPIETGNFVDFRDKPAVFLRKQEGKSDACERSRRNAVAMRTGEPRGLKRGLNCRTGDYCKNGRAYGIVARRPDMKTAIERDTSPPPCQNKIKINPTGGTHLTARVCPL